MVQEEKATWRCLIGGASKWKPGQVLHKAAGNGIDLYARYIGKDGEAFLIELSWTPPHLSFAAVLHATGAMPGGRVAPHLARRAQEARRRRRDPAAALYQAQGGGP